ncbi:hypothetical protein B0T25DRAFT_567459 [Lasiosphaeria hispida]|uniref:Uncharacterized protein n=1 Tax=Lasiosphaeria hispida TaxID=260671 RepID=A0AAJ0HNP2_9PEZI|nr:hypothetical protein B0T25DRAFT_567459 [Lasiosphaeria hispida]
METEAAPLRKLAGFDFLEREIGAGPNGPPIRHVGLPYHSRANAKYEPSILVVFADQCIDSSVDGFFSSTSFAATVYDRDLDQSLGKGSVGEVYLEVAEKIIQDSACLRLLSSVQRPSLSCLGWEERGESCGKFDDSMASWSYTQTQSLALSGSPKLRVRGTCIGTARVSITGSSFDFCIPWWKPEEESNVSGFLGNGIAIYPLEPSGEITDEMLSRNSSRENLCKVAMILTGGKGWYGAPVKHVRDLASLLLACRLLWCLGDDAFGLELSEGRDPLDVEAERMGNQHRNTKVMTDAQYAKLAKSLKGLARGGNATRFLDAAGTVGRERRRFTIECGLQGVGPSETEPGDKLFAIDGASVPFVLQGVGDSYGLLVEMRQP